MDAIRTNHHNEGVGAAARSSSWNSLKLPWDLIAEYMEPLDLLACLSVSRACRRAAGRQLNQQTPTPMTAVQQSMFAAWLQAPEMGRVGRRRARPAQQYSSLSGPFRPNAICKLHETGDIMNRLFLLDYQRTYESESSILAVVDRQGCLVAIYKFSSVQYYESHLDQEVLESTHRCGLCRVRLENSGGFNPELTQLANAWTFDTPQTDWDWVHGFYGSVASPNYGLFRLFHSSSTTTIQLSPTEIAAILLHALSSDSRSIYGYVKAVTEDLSSEFYCFIGEYPWDLHLMGAADDRPLTLREIEAWKSWKEELEQSQYHHHHQFEHDDARRRAYPKRGQVSLGN